MVSRTRLALTATDLLLAGYLGIVTVVILSGGPLRDGKPWLLVAHALFAVLLILAARPTESATGRVLRDFYPLLLLGGLYAELGVLNAGTGLAEILGNDGGVQGWEAAIFGGQVSFTWIRQHPSVFWSGVLHVAYIIYYPVIFLGAPLLALRGHREVARQTLFAMMLAFVACYLVFLFFPVAGPNYAFPHPVGPVREVWSAKVVYAALGAGSSVGAAFPSSHVAATVAVAIGAWRAWRSLGVVLAIECIFLTVGVVYCQMHYALDAITGLIVGAGAAYVAPWLWSRWDSRSKIGSDVRL